ncbi:uncharacterized protein LOC107615772 [Arachis ipaensis]|uniref:uncharacterized protein LOC107615772 n=1 Tax=Arachis ipaensis TaxID=130454 RepID=UPI0007AFBBA5|nr:uncharacterized protein LOC107615772 [Arachis ipaensis]
MATMNNAAEVVRKAAVTAARAVERLGVRNGNDDNNLGHFERPMTLATFLKVKPPKFKGTLVATDADNWFRAIERSLRVQHVPEGQHVKDEFYKKYFLGAVRDAKDIELMQLRQGDMTVAEYAQWKCLKFEGGLRDDLMSSIIPLEIRNFAELVNKSKLVEECIKKVTVAKVSRQGFPPRCLSNHQAAGRRVHFKVCGIRQHKNLQVSNITARRTGKNGGKVRQGNGKRAHQAYINTACK